MKIKEYTLETGKPLICVPVTQARKNEIYQAAEKAIERGTDALEWRMDWFEKSDDWSQVEETLDRLSEICRKAVLLCTFRSKPQGGQRAITPEAYILLLQNIAGSGLADLLDVEVPELSEASGVIKRLHDLGQKVIGSRHYFSNTPDTERMQRDLAEMKSAGADIGKLAVMPQTPLDVIRLMEAAARIKENMPDFPLVTMAMGGLGAVSRVGGQLFGSCMTFASVGKASAPGQLPIEDTVMILDKISESMKLR
ncbi:type I 3-dehydroquinate dehydratase [Lachnospiraceae bacterium]|nr:type I 3-dehydroquinate dehydratase [Lachnospiraceae bacterium]